MDSMSCDRCGATYNVELASSRLHCPSCNHTGRLNTQLIQAAETYQNRVRRELSLAGGHELVAQRYAELSSGWRLIWFMPFMISLPLCMFAVSVPQRPDAGIPTQVMTYLPLAALLVGLVGNFGFGRRNRSSNLDRAQLEVGGARCRYCGAPNHFDVGAMVTRCEFCHASLLANTETIQHGVAQAIRAQRISKVEALQSERQWSIRLARNTRVLLAVVRFNMIAVPLVVGTLFSISDSPDIRENAAAGWGLCGLSALGFGAHSAWKRRQLGRAAKITESLAARFGGRPLRGVPALAEWLDVFWSDDYPVYQLASAANSPGVACAVKGFPSLLIIDPFHSSGSIEVLLSAHYEGLSEIGKGSEKNGKLAGRPLLLEQGFELHSGPSGIRASLSGSRSNVFRQKLDLEETLLAMAAMARSQGGQPQEPLLS